MPAAFTSAKWMRSFSRSSIRSMEEPSRRIEKYMLIIIYAIVSNLNPSVLHETNNLVYSCLACQANNKQGLTLGWSKFESIHEASDPHVLIIQQNNFHSQCNCNNFGCPLPTRTKVWRSPHHCRVAGWVCWEWCMIPMRLGDPSC